MTLASSAPTRRPRAVPSMSPFAAAASPDFERRAVTSSGPANAVPAIMASWPEMRNLKGNVTLSSRRTARMRWSAAERAMTNSTPPAARDWRLGETVIVPAIDAASLAAAPGGGAASTGGWPGGSEASGRGAAREAAGPDRSRDVRGRSDDAGAEPASGGGPGFSRHEGRTAARRQATKARRASCTGSFYAMASCFRGGDQAESADERSYLLPQHVDGGALVGRHLLRGGQTLPAGEDRVGGLPQALDF